MQRNFNEHLMMHVPITENQLAWEWCIRLQNKLGWTFPKFLTLDMWHNQSKISSFPGRKLDQPKTPSQWVKMRAFQKQWQLHSNHQLWNLLQLGILGSLALWLNIFVKLMSDIYFVLCDELVNFFNFIWILRIDEKRWEVQGKPMKNYQNTI